MKKKGISLMRFGLTLFILGIMLCIVSKDFFLSLKEPVDIYQLYPEDIKPGLHVQTDIDMIWDYLYTETTTHTTYGIKTSEEESARGYVIPLCYVDDDGYIQVDKFMGMKISRSADYDTLENIMDETYEWWIGEDLPMGYTVYPIEGKIVKMGSDEKELMEEYLTDYLGMTQSEADEYMLPYMLVPIYPNTDRIMLIIGAIITIVGLLIMILNGVKINKMGKNTDGMSFQVKSNDPYVVPAGSMNSTYTSENTGVQSDMYGQSTYGATNSADVQNDMYGQNSYETQQTTEQNLYGSQPTANQNLYGSQSTANQSLYGSQPTANQSLYGSQPAANQSLYGSQPTANQSLYGRPPAANQSLYGSQSKANQSLYGDQSSANQSIYGEPSVPNQNLYENQLTSDFGTPISPDMSYNNQPADLFGAGSYDTSSNDLYAQAPYDTTMDMLNTNSTDNQ